VQLTDRRRNVLSGAIALLLLVSSVTVGVKSAFGAYAGGYKVVGSFDAAGQGLLPGSDVKVRGVNVGSVRSIRLEDGRARVTMRLHDGEEVPSGATARIRAKTLFGEKYVDLDLTGTDEAKGPFLRDGDTIERTEGGFELEAVLDDLYPVLKSIDGKELYAVVHNLAEGGRGLGEEINRTLVNGEKVADVSARHLDDTAQLLTDLAKLSDQLAGSADDLVGIAVDSNRALPVLNSNEAALVTILQQTGRLSNDVADLLLGNRPFVDAALGDGSKALQVLYSHRNQVVPLVIGLRQYLQTLTEVIRIKVGDGTLMGAVKAILGAQLCALIPCGGPGNPQASAATSASATVPASTSAAPFGGARAPALPGRPSSGLVDTLRGVLGG
jgi:virulence factor Mce-like protein